MVKSGMTLAVEYAKHSFRRNTTMRQIASIDKSGIGISTTIQNMITIFAEAGHKLGFKPAGIYR
jgi:hypothetical protein